MSGYVPLAPFAGTNYFWWYYSLLFICFVEQEKLLLGEYNVQYEMDIDIAVPSDREAVIIFDCHGTKFSYNFSFRPLFFNSNSKEGKQIVIDESRLLKKAHKMDLKFNKNISSFGRS